MTQVQQNKLLNVRVSPQIYDLFKQKIAAIGLNPSAFLRHVIISVAISDKVNIGGTFEEQYKQLVSSLKRNTLTEEEAMELTEKERISLYTHQ